MNGVAFNSRGRGNIRAEALIGTAGAIGMTCGGGRDSAIEVEKIVSGVLACCFGRGNMVSNR